MLQMSRRSCRREYTARLAKHDKGGRLTFLSVQGRFHMNSRERSAAGFVVFSHRETGRKVSTSQIFHWVSNNIGASA